MTVLWPDYSIVIPLYNEEACVERSVLEVIHALEEPFAGRYELILVINGSTDRTGDLCQALAARFTHIKLVCTARNLGYGGGILRGMAEAQGRFCGFMCGDGQVPGEALVRVMRKIAQGPYDLVKVRRISRGDGVARQVQSTVYNMLFRALFRIPCRDINAMPKLLRMDVYQQLALESTDWFIDAEIMIKAHHAGLRIHELPTTYLRRVGGSSVVRLSTVFEFLGNARRILASGKLAEWKRICCLSTNTEMVTAANVSDA